ncbi:hypothetical protein D3C80_1851980 [compost metagenome]
MIRPQPLDNMPSMTCLVVLNKPVRLVPITLFQSSGVSLRKEASRVMPALLTSTSIGPNCSRAISKALRVVSQSVTSP